MSTSSELIFFFGKRKDNFIHLLGLKPKHLKEIIPMGEHWRSKQWILDETGLPAYNCVQPNYLFYEHKQTHRITKKFMRTKMTIGWVVVRVVASLCEFVVYFQFKLLNKYTILTQKPTVIIHLAKRKKNHCSFVNFCVSLGLPHLVRMHRKTAGGVIRISLRCAQ